MEGFSVGSLLLQLGVGGAFAVIILVVVFAFLKKTKSSVNSPRCVNIPEVRDAIKNNTLSTASLDRCEQKIDGLSKESTIQTTHLRIIAEQAQEQTKILTRIAKH